MSRPKMCGVCGDQFEVAHGMCEGCINVDAGLCRDCGADLDYDFVISELCIACEWETRADELFHAAHEEGRI